MIVVVISDAIGASCLCSSCTDLTYFMKSTSGSSLWQFNEISYLFLLRKDGCFGLWHVFNLEHFFGEIYLLVSSMLLLISVNCSSLLVLLNLEKSLILFDSKQTRRWFLMSELIICNYWWIIPNCKVSGICNCKQSTIYTSTLWAGKVTCRISGIVKSQE